MVKSLAVVIQLLHGNSVLQADYAKDSQSSQGQYVKQVTLAYNFSKEGEAE